MTIRTCMNCVLFPMCKDVDAKVYLPTLYLTQKEREKKMIEVAEDCENWSL